MDKDQIKAGVRRILQEHFQLDELEDDALLYSKDLHVPTVVSDDGSRLDSLDHVELVMAIEDEFNIQISDDQAAHLVSVDAIVAQVAKSFGLEGADRASNA